jgi:crotonobetainyl-CoA:carnitine CoA-transferase CaiB-like acyl-CoA transferase
MCSAASPKRPMSSVETSVPSVKTKLGIDYESVRRINLRIVYAITGFGQDGPYQNRPGASDAGDP